MIMRTREVSTKRLCSTYNTRLVLNDIEQFIADRIAPYRSSKPFEELKEIAMGL